MTDLYPDRDHLQCKMIRPGGATCCLKLDSDEAIHAHLSPFLCWHFISFSMCDQCDNCRHQVSEQTAGKAYLHLLCLTDKAPISHPAAGAPGSRAAEVKTEVFSRTSQSFSVPFPESEEVK